MTKKKSPKVSTTELLAGLATAAHPFVVLLSHLGVRVKAFCEQFNDQTAEQKGERIFTEVAIRKDGSFELGLKAPAQEEFWPKKEGRLWVASRHSRIEVSFNKGSQITKIRIDQKGGVVLTLNPKERSGHIRFRSSADSYFDGKAQAHTAYTDETFKASMSYEEWRDAYIRWFFN